MKKVLITGADGFIGSHLTEKLLSSGYEVKCLCQYNSIGSWGWLDETASDIKQNIEVILGDIRDPLIVYNAISGCDIVFHLAALIAIPYSYTAPSSYIDTNILGTLNVVQAARSLEIQKVVHTSTSEVYGSAQFVPINEEHPLVAQSPYAASKIGADQIALSYWRSFKTPICVLRPFNTYGPRQSSRAVIPTIITQILSGSKQIKLGSTSPTRDFNYVSDTCAAFVSMAESSNVIGKVVNSASNFEISIGKAASIIIEVMNSNAELVKDKQRLRPKNSEVERLYGDNSLLRSLTSWMPEYGGQDGFKRGISKSVDWISEPKNLARYNADEYTV